MESLGIRRNNRKGVYATMNGWLIDPFVVLGMPKDGAVRAEGPKAHSPGLRPGYM
jgi:hypothetical protein